MHARLRISVSMAIGGKYKRTTTRVLQNNHLATRCAVNTTRVEMTASVLRSPPHYSSFSENSPTPAKRFALGVTAKTSQPLGHSASAASVTDIAPLGQESSEGSERHRLYDLALRIYSAAKNGKVVDGVRFPDIAIKHEVHQLVFDVIHREYLLHTYTRAYK